MKTEKTTIKENVTETGALPEFINGIPTEKHRSKERRSLISKYYANLWKKLQKEGRINTIFNDFLGVDVYIVEKESDKKTINAASKNWQSTYAVQHLETIVKEAFCDESKPVFFTPKRGTQTKFRYKNIAILYYDFTNQDIPYLNFKVKLTIGIKSSQKHVQYYVNKIDVK